MFGGAGMFGGSYQTAPCNDGRQDARTLSSKVVTEEIAANVKFTDISKAWESQNSILTSELLEVGGGSFSIGIRKTDGVVTLFMQRNDANLMPVHASFGISFDGRDSQIKGDIIYLPKWVGGVVRDEEKNSTVGAWGWSDWMTSDELLRKAQAKADCVEMKVTIKAVCPASFSQLTARCCLQEGNPAELFEQFGHAAVTIGGSNGSSIQIPKALLCAHSSVLKAALDSTMLEGTTQDVSMPDVDFGTLKDFATCLYSGGLPPSIVTGWERLVNLLVLADKYQVTPLAEACTTYLSVCVCGQNVGKLLKVADQHGLVNLKLVLVYYATSTSKRLDALTDSDEYASFSAQLMREIMCHRLKRPIPSESEQRGDFPLLLQWGNVQREIPDDTKFESLSADTLRRACFERRLSCSGTSAELIARLTCTRDVRDCSESEASGESGAKRQRRTCS